MIVILAQGSEFTALATDFTPEEHRTVVVNDVEHLFDALRTHGQDVLTAVVGPDLDEEQALAIASEIHVQAPDLAVVLVRERAGSKLLRAAMRAGVFEVLSGTFDRGSYREALHDAVSETRLHRESGGAGLDSQPDGRIVTVFSTKGGCGKSTVATNLAVLLADRAPGQVVLVDLDLQSGDVAVLTQLLPEWTIHDAAQRGQTLDGDQLDGFLTKHEHDIKVLAAPLQPEQAEEVPPEAVTRILQLLRQRYRYVVVDGPAAFTDPLLAALDETDLTIVMASLDVPSVKGLRTTLRTLDQLGIPKTRIRRVLNRADSKVGLTVREVERSIGAAIDVAIPSSRDVPLSVNQGTPLAITNSSAPVVRAIDELRQLVHPDPDDEPTSLRERWFGAPRTSAV